MNGSTSNINGLFDAAKEFAPRSILMTTTIEEPSSHLIARKIVDRTERNKNIVVALSVFAKRNGKTHTLYL